MQRKKTAFIFLFRHEVAICNTPGCLPYIPKIE
jgi:hypothetical protein